MFSLPQPANDQSGRSDEHAIWCDDSVDDFCALCHILYRNLAEPGLEPESPDAPALLRMARIASLAHKYEFSGIQEWARKSISGSSLATNALPLDDVLFVLEVALECSWDEISANLKTRLYDCIEHETDKASLETASKLSFVLNFAERHKCISLQATAYYLYLRSIKFTFNSMERKETPTSFYSLSALNDSQRLRLFRGFANLITLKAHLRVPPPFPHHNTTCIAQGRQDRCEEAILKTWKEIFVVRSATRAPQTEIFGLLTALPANIEIFNDADTSLDCLQALSHEVAALTMKVELGLPEYFELNKNPGESIE